ncbi:Mitogen-activated protein kinase 15 [Clonorchis sinensis]|nr:Mitogen-activated protein kinase 15 [Clonorchis sinensis]
METDLHNCIKKGNILKEIHKTYIFYQLLRAVKFIHSANVIHRDLKPSNVLLDSDCHVKLCDFGLTRSLSSPSTGSGFAVESVADADFDGGDPELTEYVATRWYRAPEILLASNRYTKFVDMWSLGCILAEMLIGKPIFPGTSTINQIERIISVVPRPNRQDILALHSDYGMSVLEEALRKPSSTLDSLFPETVERNAVEMAKRLLQLNPSKRLTVEKALDHPYVQRFRDRQSELVMDHPVTPPLNDNQQLSVSDYRTKLYEIILEKRAERKIRRLLRSVQETESHQKTGSSQGKSLRHSGLTSDEGTQTTPELSATYGSSKHVVLHRPTETNGRANQRGHRERNEANYQNNTETKASPSRKHAHFSPTTQSPHYSKNPESRSKGLKNGVHEIPQRNGVGNREIDYLPSKARAVQYPLRSYSREFDNPVILRSLSGLPMNPRNLEGHRVIESRQLQAHAKKDGVHQSLTPFTAVTPGGDAYTKGVSQLGSYSQTYGTVSRSQLSQLQSRQWTR